jgi:hypothetical protein
VEQAADQCELLGRGGFTTGKSTRLAIGAVDAGANRLRLPSERQERPQPIVLRKQQFDLAEGRFEPVLSVVSQYGWDGRALYRPCPSASARTLSARAS